MLDLVLSTLILFACGYGIQPFRGEHFNGTKEEYASWLNITEEVPSVYQAQIVLNTAEIADSTSELEERLAKLVVAGQSSALAQRYQLESSKAFTSSEADKRVSVTIWKQISDGTSTSIFFSSDIDGRTAPAEVIVDDIAHLTPQQVSAILHHPFSKLLSMRSSGSFVGEVFMTQTRIEKQNEDKWWIIVCIIGIGVAVLLIGWLLLFIYFNTCGKEISKTILNQGPPHEKTVYIKDSTIQTDESHIDIANNSGRASRRRRPPDLVLPTTNQRTLQAEYVEDVAHENTQNVDANDKTTKLARKLQDTEVEVNVSIPSPELHVEENDRQLTSSQWSLESDTPIESYPPPSRKQKIPRPKAAGKVRIPRNQRGEEIHRDDITSLEASTVPPWSAYDAANQVANFFHIGYGYGTNYPRPSQPSDNGVLELRMAGAANLENPVKHYL